MNARRTVVRWIREYVRCVAQWQWWQVIVWADQVTGFYGNISARGGLNFGNGGFVEVSGKET
jgi:hypothetical protein